MNIEDRSYLAWQAMDNISDMDVSLEQYASAAAEGLGWRDLSKDVPIAGEVVVATDGKARWLDARQPWDEFKLKWQGHTATHWHPLAACGHGYPVRLSGAALRRRPARMAPH